MLQEFQPGDLLVFQLEAGFGVIRVLGVSDEEAGRVWHLAAYRDLFMDVDSAEAAIANVGSLTTEIPHVAMTGRAFASTQVARIGNEPLSGDEIQQVSDWNNGAERAVADRSIRLLLGYR
ncbi:MAG: hypothetical protein ABI539_06110 [Acidobacteriota bacterium]